jgi:hypothetical protein
MLRRLRMALILAALPGLTGCVANRMYRPGAAAIQSPPVVAGAPAHFKLAMIEFDDMGESWEKCTSLADPSNCQLTLGESARLASMGLSKPRSYIGVYQPTGNNHGARRIRITVDHWFSEVLKSAAK